MKKIFVACPAFLATGGTELLHQLIGSLKKYNGFQPLLFYCNYNIETEKPEIPEKFLKYVGKEDVTNSIEDRAGNLVIVPEVLTPLLTNYTSATKCIWWLSVDNFFIANNYRRITFFTPLIYWWKETAKMKLSHREETLFNRNDVQYHLYQSEYAREFLTARKMKNVLPLSDFLNEEFLKPVIQKQSVEKKNIVAYNPVKGFKFTKKLIKKGRDISWQPVTGMSSGEVADLLASAKVYIDFGYHPGKDRIPREAALQGCCVITGTDGAAQNPIDIPIDAVYKFKKSYGNIFRINRLIREIFQNYTLHNRNFDDYRKGIKNEKELFEKNLTSFLRIAQYLP